MSITRVPRILYLFPLLLRVLPLAAVAAACASGPGGAGLGPGTTEHVRPHDAGMRLDIYREPGRATNVLAAPVERVWPQVAAVYQELGIPVTSSDPAARVVVAAGQQLRRVGDRGIAAYFDCGGGFGNAAAQYQVVVTARTQVTPAAEGGSVVQSWAAASARGAASGTQVRCNSTGVLERTIAERLTARSAEGG